jgi:hypothetical protein
MYENGELAEVMNSFENAIAASSIYVGGKFERAETQEFEKENGRISRRYVGGNYYNNSRINELFKSYLLGFSFGKVWERS